MPLDEARGPWIGPCTLALLCLETPTDPLIPYVCFDLLLSAGLGQGRRDIQVNKIDMPRPSYGVPGL